MNKLLELPDHGRLIVVSDIHGNLEDYQRYLNLWDENDPDFHIVFTGDLIHSIHENDGSIEILDDAIEKSECSNFHTLLGNHEWAHIVNKNIYKLNKELLADFNNLISYKKGHIEPTLTQYIKYFKTMPYFIKTSNGIFISHSGPSKKVNNIHDFNNMLESDYNNEILYDFLWNRCVGLRKYSEEDVNAFLDIVGCKYMVIGHNVVESYMAFSNQLILASSFQTRVKTYLDIDLSKEYNDMKDLLKDLKFIF